MNAFEHFLFGDGALHARLCQITEVLGNFVSNAPLALDLERLERRTGQPAKDLLKLCTTLCQENILRPHAEQPQCWMLACETKQVTLEDAFRCAMSEQASRGKSSKHKVLAETPDAAEPVHREVDVLVMQATMAINQSIFQHLRQFSLDRLKMTASGMVPSGRGSEERFRLWPPGRVSFS
jgi:hypothetical protein